MAIQTVIIGLLGTVFGLIVVLVTIIGGVLLYYYRKGVRGESPESADSHPDTT